MLLCLKNFIRFEKKIKLDKDMHMCLESKNNLEKKITKLEFDLNVSKATLKKFNVGSKSLDEIISVQKCSSNKRGHGYILLAPL